MKKHIVLMMNIVLALVIIGAIVFTVMRALSTEPHSVPAETTAVESAPTEEYPTAPAGERYKVGIVQHANNEQSDSCYAGFISQLKDRGLLDHVEVMYVVEENNDKCTAEIQRLVDEGCDLIYTIGPFASTAAAAITTQIPIIFAGVSDPEEAGLVNSNEAPGGNVTGVSSYTPCFEQIDLIPVLLPQAKSMAAIYTATDENSVVQAIIAERESEEFQYEVDRYPVSKAADIAEALADIKEKGTDVIYLPIDILVYRNIDTIVAFSEENKIPVICGNEKMMQSGCLATCEINFTSIGRKSADLTYDILYGKKDPASLPVIYKYDCYILVNQEALEKQGITLSKVALENVELVDYRVQNTENLQSGE